MEESTYLKRLRERVEAGRSRLFLSLAEELWRQGRDEEALSVIQKGIAEEPSFISARVILGTRLAARAQYAEAVKELSAAAVLYDRICAEKPEDGAAATAKENLLPLLRKVDRAMSLEAFLEGIKARFGGRKG